MWAKFCSPCSGEWSVLLESRQLSLQGIFLLLWMLIRAGMSLVTWVQPFLSQCTLTTGWEPKNVNIIGTRGRKVGEICRLLWRTPCPRHLASSHVYILQLNYVNTIIKKIVRSSIVLYFLQVLKKCHFYKTPVLIAIQNQYPDSKMK